MISLNKILISRSPVEEGERYVKAVHEGRPHHVIQRGNRCQRVFFSDQAKQLYLSLLKANCDKHRVMIWAYCLMSNHVHLVLVPSEPDGLAKAIGQTHWRYTLLVNKRERWRGYLWQGRFNSFVLDYTYLRSVVRYVELNPVSGNCNHKCDKKRLMNVNAG